MNLPRQVIADTRFCQQVYWPGGISLQFSAQYNTAGGFVGTSLASLLIALYIVLMSLVSLVAVQFLKEYAGKAVG